MKHMGSAGSSHSLARTELADARRSGGETWQTHEMQHKSPSKGAWKILLLLLAMLFTVPKLATATPESPNSAPGATVVEESNKNTNWTRSGVNDTARNPTRGDTTCSTEERQQATTALPLAGKKIVVDAGHGGDDTGAIRDKVREKELNLKIALKLKKNLEDLGATVTMTRSTDVKVTLEERVDATTAACPDIFVSVHINAHTSRAIDGIEGYYWSPEGKELADTLYDGLVHDLNAPGNWVLQKQYYVVHWSPVPAALMEVGYMSNTRERNLLVTDSYQDKIAKSLADGIVKYFQKVTPGAQPGTTPPNPNTGSQKPPI